MSSLDDGTNYLELVKKAQLGCRDSMDILAHLVQRSLFVYIYRLTLNNDVTEDLRQETMLEMVKSLKRLKFEHFDQFWAWLYRTAFGKVQHYFRNLRHERIQKMSTLDKEHLLQHVSESYGDGLKSLISKELSESVIEAMCKLKLRHRNILVLRCFGQMSYSKIADIMNCSETAAQVLFFRAKRSLKQKLSKHGFGKGMLIAALGLFGKMTAPADAAPSAVTLTATSTKVGLIATVIGTVGTKLGITIGTAIATIAISVC